MLWCNPGIAIIDYPQSSIAGKAAHLADNTNVSNHIENYIDIFTRYSALNNAEKIPTRQFIARTALKVSHTLHFS